MVSSGQIGYSLLVISYWWFFRLEWVDRGSLHFPNYNWLSVIRFGLGNEKYIFTHFSPKPPITNNQ